MLLVAQPHFIMFRFSVLLFCIFYIDTFYTQVNTYTQGTNYVNLTFHDKVFNCKLVNKGELIFNKDDCHMFIYINNKQVAATSGVTISHKYTALLKVTARCDASCIEDPNIVSMEMEINKVIFIGMCAGAAAVFLLLVVAIACGVKHCRGNYRKLPQDNQDTEVEEKNKDISSTV